MDWTTTGAGETPGLQTRRYVVGAFPVLELVGVCDLATREPFTSELDAVVNTKPRGLIVDLTQVGFCDAGCAGQLLNAARNTPVALVGLDGGITSYLFDLLDPAADFTRYRTVDEAVDALSTSRQ